MVVEVTPAQLVHDCVHIGISTLLGKILTFDSIKSAISAKELGFLMELLDLDIILL